ncbi:MAG: GGDEF-domain containing protein [Denitrovibrio sp.]|nr:MAG: GGDEF-domain containing protein [Denitrovibrio sp.]
MTSQEIMLNILGSQVIQNIEESNEIKYLPIFDNLLENNPSIPALALLRPDGNFIYISNNADISKLPNLLKLEASGASFQHALDNPNKMVLGRTYYFKPIGEWVIPIRKAISTSNGQIKAVLANGFRLKTSSDLFNNGLHMGDYNDIEIIRDFDDYPLHISAENVNQKSRYNKQIPQEIFKQINMALQKVYNTTLDEARHSKDIYTFHLDINGKEVITSIRYDNRYELWTMSHTKHAVITKAIINTVTIYITILITFLLVLFFIFRYIANAEEAKRQELLYQANHDTLTKLPNRNYLINNIHHWIDQKSTPFSVLYIYIDNFKNVNDSFGHHIGDLLMQEIAIRICDFVHKESLVIHMGGDEFIILSREIVHHELNICANQLIAKLSEPYKVEDISFNLSASIGISRYPEDGINLDNILRAADIAMHQSKKQKNTASVFQSEMQDSYLYRVNIEQELKNAIKNQELHMVYQPQLQDGKIIGVEALVRWINPKLGFVGPDSFIPVAESSGMMPPLGEYITNTSLSEIKEVFDATNTEFILSINISLKQFIYREFLSRLVLAIKASGINENQIKLEITENLFIEDFDHIVPLLNKIHDLGMKISLDDFGTGYSSLNILRFLPVDELKIDKSFIDDILTDLSAQKMVRNIIDICTNQNLQVIAEGVETEPQLTMLTDYGCDRFQGYLFAKPMKKDDLIAFIKSSK